MSIKTCKIKFKAVSLFSLYIFIIVLVVNTNI